jgi:hypothetical protein
MKRHAVEKVGKVNCRTIPFFDGEMVHAVSFARRLGRSAGWFAAYMTLGASPPVGVMVPEFRNKRAFDVLTSLYCIVLGGSRRGPLQVKCRGRMIWEPWWQMPYGLRQVTGQINEVKI